MLNLQEDIYQEPPPNLELFGYGSQIHPMTRDPTTGAHRLCPRWPYPKVYFRTANDYGDEDWEWLLRHHGYGEDEEGRICKVILIDSPYLELTRLKSCKMRTHSAEGRSLLRSSLNIFLVTLWESSGLRRSSFIEGLER